MCPRYRGLLTCVVNYAPDIKIHPYSVRKLFVNSGKWIMLMLTIRRKSSTYFLFSEVKPYTHFVAESDVGEMSTCEVMVRCFCSDDRLVVKLLNILHGYGTFASSSYSSDITVLGGP